MKRIEPTDMHVPEPVFQLLWAGLHLTASVMHFGSVIYHLRRVQRDA